MPNEPVHGELCLSLALGCGPCQLVKGHRPPNRHLCDHYAKGGVEFHDPNDSYCCCPGCQEVRLVEAFDREASALLSAQARYNDAKRALAAHKRRFNPHARRALGEVTDA